MDDNPYADDEIESAWQRADDLAIQDHNKTDASKVHAMVGFRLWTALRDLGAIHGRMLVTGIDPHEFAQLPRDRVQVMDGDGYGMLVADIPPDRPRTDDGTDDPHEVSVESLVDEPGSLYDVVIHNAHLGDVTVHQPGLREHFLQIRHVALLTGLARTRPGGLFAALMPREVMDDPHPGVREAVTALGDVLGAVRLPGGALRNVAGCDNPTDLILVRRRPDQDVPTDQSAFLHVEHLLPPSGIPRGHEHVNRYYAEKPWQVLGTLDARPILGGLPRLTVRPDDSPLADQLSRSLRRIVRSARSRNLVAGPGPRQADSPHPARGPSHRPEPPHGPEIDL
ncbi:hypothetical protein [Promicromonospora sp. NPDC057488]|uniref:hypothetical protein n=1 Tax=Promicromonospora sp. NPDC057488 TaxID=3346147 RepID=UPI0036735243